MFLADWVLHISDSDGREIMRNNKLSAVSKMKLSCSGISGGSRGNRFVEGN